MSIPDPGLIACIELRFQLPDVDCFYGHFFQPRDMHPGSPIQYYALYNNNQRGVVPLGNTSSDAPKF